MNPVTSICQLRPVSDNPRFEGVAFLNEKSLLRQGGNVMLEERFTSHIDVTRLKLEVC